MTPMTTVSTAVKLMSNSSTIPRQQKLHNKAIKKFTLQKTELDEILQKDRPMAIGSSASVLL